MNISNFSHYQKLLSEFVSFKSISTDSKYTHEIKKTVSWLLSLLKENGLKVNLLKSKDINPVVFAEYEVSKNCDTALIYGHYDVQPAQKTDGWNSEPFILAEKNGRLFGRGVVDNKGQIMIHIATILNLIKENKLNYNVKFLIEGDEETGNTALSDILKKYKNELNCDFALVSDGELTNNNPTIEVSLRGGFNCTLSYRSGKNNLHSGIYGGAVPNAAHELAKFLSKIYNRNNSVSFKDFYTDADKITAEQLKNNRKLLKEAKDLTKLAQVKSLLTEKGYDFFTQTGLRPTIQVTGLKSGYIDEGYANIVPAFAEARLNFRITASQKPEKIFKAFAHFVKENTPKYIEYELTSSGMHNPIKINVKNPHLKKAEFMLKKVYGKPVSYRNVGGAIPFVGDVKKILKVDTLLVPFGNEDCNMHGANENFEIKLIQKGLDFSYSFLSQ